MIISDQQISKLIYFAHLYRASLLQLKDIKSIDVGGLDKLLDDLNNLLFDLNNQQSKDLKNTDKKEFLLIKKIESYLDENYRNINESQSDEFCAERNSYLDVIADIQKFIEKIKD